MAYTRTPRHGWIEEGLRALAEGGPEAVRVEPLARSLGVSKGGFYGYFDGRDALLEEMLDEWERTLVDEVIERTDSCGGDARAKLSMLAGQATDDAVEVDLAVRDWARRDLAVAQRLRRVDTRRVTYMRSLFAELCADPDEVEVRCMLAFSLWIGNHFIAAEHPDRARSDVVRSAFQWLLR